MSVNLGNDTKAPSPIRTPDEVKESKYEPKQNKKLIRLVTVIAYIISVSMAAIILSLYYVFLWDPQMKYQPKAKQSTTGGKTSHSFDDNRPTLISLPFSSHEEIAAASDLREGQPTPKVLPVFKDGYDGAPAAHFTPTQPLPAHRFESSQVVNTDAILGHSLHQSHRSTREHQQHEQQQQRHYQMQRHQQQHLQQQHQQEAYTALA